MYLGGFQFAKLPNYKISQSLNDPVTQCFNGSMIQSLNGPQPSRSLLAALSGDTGE